jgi:nitrite reductase (NADH) small subunit
VSATIDTGFVAVGQAAHVPLLEGRRTTVDGRRIAVFRVPGGWRAVDAACPHAGGPLQDGIVADGCVTCPLHGRRYAFEDLVEHEVEERDGVLWVRLGA